MPLTTRLKAVQQRATLERQLAEHSAGLDRQKEALQALQGHVDRETTPLLQVLDRLYRIYEFGFTGMSAWPRQLSQ